VGDVSRFSSAAKLVAYAGLGPMVVRSGSSVAKQTRNSGIGSEEARQASYMASLVGIRHDPLLKAFYERLVAHGKNKKAAPLACVAILLRVMYGVLIHQRPFDANYAAT